ncbi:ATP-grasp domain-containing protein [Aliarcobacter butzleri]|uniref:ATP-grasp domain-containing protein n=1 Tax=Aliarcobacter butzleri TaxID=28197 RepID=UPI00263CE048|nr:ATP-grasp domain-containing protein [Aliarcobacter butzleri]MCG3717623.1 ATP-grasp domain-containing protein [Aliarcobacter butzleri]MDN5083076.1 ATP-grasp domain-containing protein [Aliarcobacter butzleri]MDN5085156.1 ATP-grasp domain-containing protein [Aliarcobacter butzleri]MDN5087295.1 ATP-grasp domain-containing protein [Aliarcobacter butzleri]
MNKNILITSISSKVPLIKTVKKAKNKFDKSIKIFGIDSANKVLGKYFVDEFYILPKLKEFKIEDFIDFCKRNKIKYIIPTRDEDLLFYSSYNKILLKKNIYLFSPDNFVVNMCNDKYLFTKENKIDFNIKTSLNIKDLKNVDSYVVKDRFGSGSKNIGLNLKESDAIEFSKKLKNPIFQEFIEGEEYSIDSYVSKSNKFVGCIIRKREFVKNGESIITYSLKDDILERKIKNFLLKNNIIGHSITQVIKKDNNYFLIECNTRFGGASTLSDKMGLKSFYWFLCEMNDKIFKFKRNKKNFMQIRIPKDIYYEC